MFFKFLKFKNIAIYNIYTWIMYAKIPKLNIKIGLVSRFGWIINRYFKYFWCCEIFFAILDIYFWLFVYIFKYIGKLQNILYILYIFWILNLKITNILNYKFNADIFRYQNISVRIRFGSSSLVIKILNLFVYLTNFGGSILLSESDSVLRILIFFTTLTKVVW